jgi:NAD(P)H dehydrogenase (quinone)
MIALTGATGQLGHYVLQDLLKTVPASQIVAIVRNPAKAQRSASRALLSARPTIATKRR